eukprot:GILK01004535.1.p1 GENE.GILK01004535.1~~GILK01004535.1.p1  ORF type:complete len:722 (-),score=169.57 GILK01004535.1:175-2340(-)
MDLSLARLDLTQVASTARKTLKVLPSSKKKNQAVVVGDDAGIVTCFSMRKGELRQIFKSNPMGKEISRLELGGPVGKKDKIFLAAGQTIRGMTKKGKEFFKCQTNLTETINSMFVEDKLIWTGGEYIYNLFDDCKDAAFYMSSDKINDLIVEHVVGLEYNAILACQDKFIRVLRGGECFLSTSLEGPVLSLSSHTSQPLAEVEGFKQVVYGTANGCAGLLYMQNDSMLAGWKISNDRRKGGITNLKSWDMTKDGVRDILIGRDDGSVEVYGFDMSSEPALQFKTQLSESITSLDAGCISNSGYDELVVSTYSGKVVALSSDPSAAGSAPATTAEDIRRDREEGPKKERKAKALKKELDQLKEKVDDAKRKYQAVSADLIGVTNTFKVNSKFTLESDDAAYSLVVEGQMPLDMVMLQCDVNLELWDVDSNVAIVSRSPPDPENGSLLLATYRCQESVNRLELKIRTIEGQYGTLQAFVIPRLTPKTCQVLHFPIKPLSLHERVHELQGDVPLNELRLSGNFTLGDMHAWVSTCLPNVPPKVQEEEVMLHFKSAFLGTVLVCSYQKGLGVFRSDSISTISIVKEVISKEATSRKIRLDIAFDIKEESVRHFLSVLYPKLEAQHNLTQQFQLIESLKEIKLQEPDISFLSADLLGVLDNADEIKKQYELQPRKLSFLHGVITDFYIDRQKFKGHLNVKHKMSALMSLLQNCNLDSLVQFFNESV